MIDQIKIGSFLRELRKEKAKTQEEIAEMYGVTSRSVSRWENGNTMPDLSILVELADYYDVDIREILDGERKSERVEREKKETLLKVANYAKKEKKKAITKAVIISVGLGLLFYFIMLPGIVLLLLGFSSKCAKIKTYNDASKYEKYIGPDAEKRFAYKHGVDESIFPDTIKNGAEVLEFQMTYYNPWEEQYLSYLTVQYSDDMYQNEKERLCQKGIVNYRGIYCVNDEPEGFDLLALATDSYSGFVYAIVPEKQNNAITYVEIAFSPYYLDLDAKDYIPQEYLLTGFDASIDNAYRIEKMK